MKTDEAKTGEKLGEHQRMVCIKKIDAAMNTLFRVKRMVTDEESVGGFEKDARNAFAHVKQCIDDVLTELSKAPAKLHPVSEPAHAKKPT